MKGEYRKAVFIVVYAIEKNEVFYAILKRKKHWTGWEFPKGGVDGNESLEKTAKREAFEETGRRVISLKRYPISGQYRYTKILEDRPNMIGQTYTLFSFINSRAYL